MNCLPLLLCLTSLLDSALASLPAPVNLSVQSVNFRHVLRWDPGPGTPPGAEYTVYQIIRGVPKLKWRSKTTSVELVLKDPNKEYQFTVQASYNGTVSPQSKRRAFTPFIDTEIGAPNVSLAGCGLCIQINISLPEPDRRSGVSDIHSKYQAEYRIRVKRSNGGKEISFKTGNRTYNLSNLLKGEEYCVQVLPLLTVNENVQSSAWECTFTSIVGPNRGPVVLGSVASLVILVIGAGMASTYLLYYTGFICKLKATLPRALIAALSGGYTLTPERTIPDQISIIPDKQRRQNNPTMPKPASRHANSEEEEEEDDEEEEEAEGLNAYMDRPADLSSDQSSSQDSGNTSGSRTLEAEVPELEVVHEGLEEDEAKAEGAAEVPFIPEETGVKEHITGEEVEEEEQQEEEEEEQEEVCHSSGNVDLFSITLGSLAAHEEEEEEEEEQTGDSLTNHLRLYQQRQAATDSQTELDSQTAEEALEDFTGSGYEVKRADMFSDFFKTCEAETQEEEEEEEEDEEEEEEDDEFSGYMRHT